MISELKTYLEQRPKTHISEPKRIPSAVLVPLYCKNGEYHVLFIQRSQSVKYHKGQISFPGGAYEQCDEKLSNTALRESTEEVGIAPSSVEILGELDDILTYTSNFVITPFVGFIARPNKFIPDWQECTGFLEVPLKELVGREIPDNSRTDDQGKPVATQVFRYNGKEIWGATAEILVSFLDIIKRFDYCDCTGLKA